MKHHGTGKKVLSWKNDPSSNTFSQSSFLLQHTSYHPTKPPSLPSHPPLLRSSHLLTRPDPTRRLQAADSRGAEPTGTVHVLEEQALPDLAAWGSRAEEERGRWIGVLKAQGTVESLRNLNLQNL